MTATSGLYIIYDNLKTIVASVTGRTNRVAQIRETCENFTNRRGEKEQVGGRGSGRG